MIIAYARIVVLALALGIFPVAVHAQTDTGIDPKAAQPIASTASVPGSEVIADLQQRLVAMQVVLGEIKKSGDDAARRAAMTKHWQAMQDYMASSLKLLPPQPMAPPAPGTPDCRTVPGAWKGLSFPGQAQPASYQKSMQKHLNLMRADLKRMRTTSDTAKLQHLARIHWDSNYKQLQTMRGLGWMFASWMPTKEHQTQLPDPKSEGAGLVSSYCTECHGVPAPRLHSGTEWDSIMTTMTRHMEQSDTGPPVCVRVASASELQAIGEYLRTHAR